MSKRVFTFDGLVNAEINSIEAVAGVLGWFLAIGAGNQTDEEFEEKIDLVFHCWLPILNNNFLLYETFKEMIDRGEDAPMDTFDDGRPFLDYKSIPKTEFTLTRSDLINIQTEVANNLDPDTNLMFFEQAASRVESIGLGLVTIAIANGIADAGDGIDENENAMLERMFAIYGTERGNEEILQSDVWMMMEMNCQWVRSAPCISAATAAPNSSITMSREKRLTPSMSGAGRLQAMWATWTRINSST